MEKVKKIILSVITSSVFIFLAFGSDSEKKKVSEMTSTAYVMSQTFVKQRIKSPSTADFPTMDAKTTYLGDSTFFIISYFDSQNSFGAMLRTNYTATVKFRGNDQWELRAINFQ